MRFSPYAFAFNDPVFYNDPGGAYPENTYFPQTWDPMAMGPGSGGDAVFEPLYPSYGPQQYGQHFIGYGSGNHWADGMQYSDWSAHGGSQMFRDAKANGARLVGGTQYVMDADGQYQALSSRGGQLGYWEMNVNMVADAYSSDGLAVATEMVFYVQQCPTCSGSNYIPGLSPGFTIDPFSHFRNISDHTNYPGINIYEHPDMSGGITLPGIGILIGSDYSGRSRTRLLQHEYGHFLDSQWGWVTPNSPSSTANFYIAVGIPSLFSATMSRLGLGDHGTSWTEVRANDWAKAWFGDRLDPDFESFYPTSNSLSNE